MIHIEKGDNMILSQLMLNEFNDKIYEMENEVQRRKGVSNYLEYLRCIEQLTYEDIVCAISWLDHTTKTADEIIEILKKGE